jgi:ankyrin repeat protein
VYTAAGTDTQERREAVVVQLIEAGADVDKANNEGETPLFKAAHKGHEAVVKLLIAAKADVDKADNKGRTPLDIIWQQNQSYVKKSYSPHRENQAIVKRLREAGASVVSAFSAW